MADVRAGLDRGGAAAQDRRQADFLAALRPQDAARLLTAHAHIANSTGLSIEITATGWYEIADQRLDWRFGGGVAVIADLGSSRGRDRAGAYREISFAFAGPTDERRRGAIRLYDRRAIVLFTLNFVDPGTTDEAFPILSRYPRGLHHLSYTGVFGRYSFSRFGTDGPWTFFDDRANAFILSPAAHFMNGALSFGPSRQLRSGIEAEPPRIPAGFVHETVLAVAPGINRAFESWGNFLTDRAGKQRPANDADPGLKYLGYWTDHGARYYYRTAPRADYTATLLAVRDGFRAADIGLGYMQLDSWFYRKGRKGEWRSGDTLGGGTYLYEAAPEVFPEGLRAFQRELSLPLVTHNRWIDARSPYRKRYAISGNVATDPALWAKWMRDLRAAGVMTYEQDWLRGEAAAERNLEAGEQFMDAMAAAARRENITLQYSMALPRHFLQGASYANLTTIRTSGDRLREKHWRSFLFNGRLATALGIWPWADVFMSGETQHLLLATLSGGMVGVGDSIGKLDRDSLLRAIRPDGIIVKPDTPLTPLDASYIAHAKNRTAPLVATARTDHDGWVTTYIHAFGRRRVSVSPAVLGYDGPVYVYDYFRRRGIYLKPGASFTIATAARIPSFWIVVPVAKSGIGFLGDAGKFVANGKRRVARIADNGTLSARILLAKGEDRVRLQGFARARPTVSARDGGIEDLRYDPRSRLFQFDLAARPGAAVEIVMRVRHDRGK
jgi:hypothetical protein